VGDEMIVRIDIYGTLSRIRFFCVICLYRLKLALIFTSSITFFEKGHIRLIDVEIVAGKKPSSPA
jgi:hypothetical protein